MLRNVLPLTSYLLVFAVLWWAIAEGRPDGLWLSAPAAALALAARRRLGARPGFLIRPGASVRFVPYFLWLSVSGGLDVARRALARRPRLAPALRVYRMKLRTPEARIFFARSLSLLPGTFTADIDADRLTVHLLDVRLAVAAPLRRLETLVAAMYGERVAAEGPRNDWSGREPGDG